MDSFAVFCDYADDACIQHMLHQFEYPPNPRMPAAIVPLPLRTLGEQKSSLAALLRRIAD